jgi:hypothetical protein
MADIRNLVNQIVAQEAQLRDTQFLARCVRRGQVRTSVATIIYTFISQPQDFEGWGIFQPVDGKTATSTYNPSLALLKREITGISEDQNFAFLPKIRGSPLAVSQYTES